MEENISSEQFSWTSIYQEDSTLLIRIKLKRDRKLKKLRKRTKRKRKRRKRKSLKMRKTRKKRTFPKLKNSINSKN